MSRDIFNSIIEASMKKDNSGTTCCSVPMIHEAKRNKSQYNGTQTLNNENNVCKKILSVFEEMCIRNYANFLLGTSLEATLSCVTILV